MCSSRMLIQDQHFSSFPRGSSGMLKAEEQCSETSHYPFHREFSLIFPLPLSGPAPLLCGNLLLTWALEGKRDVSCLFLYPRRLTEDMYPLNSYQSPVGQSQYKVMRMPSVNRWHNYYVWAWDSVHQEETGTWMVISQVTLAQSVVTWGSR